jgi:hypothetical protein
MKLNTWMCCNFCNGIYSINNNGRMRAHHIHLGSFRTISEAVSAYNAGAIKYHGEFARISDYILSPVEPTKGDQP